MQMRKLALSMLLIGMSSTMVHAADDQKSEATSDTLQKIKNNGVIVVGH
ncbi:glutamate/aspartate ABC transporter substrate-binding protein, partial [Hafnia paralvei]|nr:glutamate/aspartate ABC transporter substrate-binding protein [Hafnia paralvei]